MKFTAMIWNKGMPPYLACVLAMVVGLLSGRAAAEEVQPRDARPVLERWADLIAARLAQTNPATPAIAPAIGPGPSLKPGMAGERVDRLAAQLKARGFLAADAYHGLYDSALEAAVSAYQTSAGLPADGVAGDSSVESLDRDPNAAALALRTTLDGMRALAAEAPKELFLVNIPSQTAYLIQDGAVTMTMRTAVGRPSRPTPVLTDQVTDVVINPTWTAPSTVLVKDKLPSLRRTRHPGIEGATIYLDRQEVDPATVDWTTVTPERIRIVQSPGDQNALGRFKFNLTNSQSIYLHDTNDHSVFARQGRALSSGCVRLAEPRRLAETLLGRDGWTSDRIDHALDAEHTQYIGLRHPLPVRIVYWQASVDDTGIVRIHRDIYGQNNQQLAANSRHFQTLRISQPRQLFFSQPAAPAPVEEADGLAGLFNKLVTLVRTLPSLPTAQQGPSTPPAQLEQVAVEDGLPKSDGAHCTESCGWGLY